MDHEHTQHTLTQPFSSIFDLKQSISIQYSHKKKKKKIYPIHSISHLSSIKKHFKSINLSLSPLAPWALTSQQHFSSRWRQRYLRSSRSRQPRVRSLVWTSCRAQSTCRIGTLPTDEGSNRQHVVCTPSSLSGRWLLSTSTCHPSSEHVQ